MQFTALVNLSGGSISYTYGIVFIYSDNNNEQHSQSKNKHQTNQGIFTSPPLLKSFQRII